MSKVTYHKKKTYAMALVSPVIMERENRYWLPDEPIVRPACAWAQGGKIIGDRYYGPMCLPNPRKTTSVKVLMPDEPATEQLPVMVEAAPTPEAGSCVLL